MKNQKLLVDISVHEKVGMKILSLSDVVGRRQNKPGETWPSNPAFNPRGVTLEEVDAAMALCFP